ncbi:MAG: glycosyltransferase family 4 protein, partial [Planctomycetes bacterium]|nr:glycosyltransferase family 4 protein [Planctomycetota bacterium]
SIAQTSPLGGARLRVAGYLARDQIAYASRLRRLLTSAGLGRRVELVGTVDRPQKLAFLRDLDLLVLPSIYPDPKAMSLLEALASGVPVVAPAHGAFPELIEATGGGVLFEPQDVPGLAEAMRGLLLDPGRRRELGSAGRQAVHERFGADRMARETLEVYRCLAAAGAEAAPAEPGSRPGPEQHEDGSGEVF